jgi:uncharacterized membrane protein YkvA (DUF1232 family)
MSTLDSRCLDAFPNWLRGLADDARALAGLLERDELAEPARRRAASSLNYLFKSLDLIPDGLEDLGFIDDAFVLRTALARAAADDRSVAKADNLGTIERLAQDAELIREFLAEDYDRLARYVAELDKSSARGRSVDDILQDAALRNDFVREVRQWADGYAAPTFSRDARNLVKLKSFLSKKLPA